MVGRRDLDGDDEDGDGVDELGAARTHPQQSLGPREGALNRILGGHGPAWHCAEDSLKVAH